MVDSYNPWNAFEQGARIGANARQASNRRRLGDAYQEGGIESLETEAFGQGDVATGSAARRFRNDQEAEVYARFERVRPWLIPAIRRAAQMPPEQARAFLNQPHLRSRLTDVGLPEDAIERGIAGLTSENPEERREMAAQLESAFTAHQDPEWQLQTVPREGGGVERRPVAIGPRGDIMQGEGSLPAEPGDWQAGYGRAYRINPDGSTEMGGQIPQAPRGGAGARGYSIVSPGEVEALGLPPGSYQRNNSTGQITVLGRQRGQYTDAAASSAQFASRMAAADQTLSGLEDSFTDPTGVFAAQAGMGSQYERQVRQAQREFVNAILRRESGAVIADDEFRSASQQYFPQPGDGPAVVAQKRAARQRSIIGLRNASQGAYDEWYGEGSGAELPPPTPPTGSVIGATVGAQGAPAPARPPGVPPNAQWNPQTRRWVLPEE